jgi:hypothetical protein
MSKVLLFKQDPETRVNVVDAFGQLAGSSDWSIEFTVSDFAIDNVNNLEGVFAVIAPPYVITLSLDGAGVFYFSHALVQFTVSAGNSPIKVISTASGNSVEINGTPVTPSYTTGNSSTAIPIGASVSAANLFGSGIMADLILGKDGSDVSRFLLSDGDGAAAHDSIGGYDAPITNAHWINEPSKIATNRINIFSDPAVDFSSAPSDEQWCLFADSDGNPIRHSGNWSAYTKDDIFRNSGCWYNKKPITCMSIHSEIDPTNYRFPATLISPRHVLLAEHVVDDDAGRWVGAEITFADMSNNKQTTTLLDSTNVSGDLTVGILADDITLDVDVASFLPASFVNNTANEGAELFNLDFPACCPAKEGILSVENCKTLLICGIFNPKARQREYAWSRYSISATRTGDSQRPNFIFHDDVLFILFLAESVTVEGDILGVGVNGDSVKTSIKSTMDALDSTHSRTPSYELVIGNI